MTDPINDAEIHEIVQRVLSQVVGSSAREPAVSNTPASTKTEISEQKVVAIGADHGGFE